jgi:positive phototaxis protein PixI
LNLSLLWSIDSEFEQAIPPEINKLNMVVQHQLMPNGNLSPEDRQTRYQFLKFYLQPNVPVVIAIHQGEGSATERVTELMNIPIDRVVPMPHLPSAVMGVYNWRGEILWIADLARLLELKPQTPQRTRILQPTIVISNADPTGELKTIGLVVDAIADIEWYEPHLTSHLPHHPALSPWLKGYWRQASGEILPELDAQALLDRANLHADL